MRKCCTAKKSLAGKSSGSAKQNRGLPPARDGLKQWRHTVCLGLPDKTMKVAPVVVAARRGLPAGGNLPNQWALYRTVKPLS